MPGAKCFLAVDRMPLLASCRKTNTGAIAGPPVSTIATPAG